LELDWVRPQLFKRSSKIKIKIKINLELDLRAQTFDEGSVYFAVSSRYLKNNNCFCFKSFLKN
jgi:hypothetical protein